MRSVAAIVVAVFFVGCGGNRESTPAHRTGNDPYAVRSDEEMERAVATATTRAAQGGKRTLLIYVGDRGDGDTRAVVRLLGEEPAASAVARGYERVFVNLGTELGRHVVLRRAHDVTALVTFVVVDPTTHRRVARRVFAPATGNGTVTSDTLGAWLDDPHGR